MKDFAYYTDVKTPYPKKGDFITVYVYHQGKLLFTGTMAQFRFRDEAKEFPNGRVTQQIVDEDGFKAARSTYYTEANALSKQFTEDLYAEFGVEDNPKRHDVYMIAYDHGHSAGYQEVYSWFQELVELIR